MAAEIPSPGLRARPVPDVFAPGLRMSLPPNYRQVAMMGPPLLLDPLPPRPHPPPPLQGTEAQGVRKAALQTDWRAPLAPPPPPKEWVRPTFPAPSRPHTMATQPLTRRRWGLGRGVRYL
nr:proline-rich receptor-like protein kinase PERK2 [Penaeus vannamei]